MATGGGSSSDEKHSDELREVIHLAVLGGYGAPIRRAVEAIRDHGLDKKTHTASGKRTGKKTLDFLPSKTTQVGAKFISHSPLMLACEKEDVAVVEILLELNASAAFKNKEGLNALHIACNKGNLRLCKLLLEKAQIQDHFVRKSQLKCDISVLVNAREKRGWTPLMYAVKSKHSAEMIKTLMETETANVDYSKTNKKKSNFIHIACNEGSVEGIQHIIANPPPLISPELKALFTAVDKKGWNILHHACSTSATVDGVSLVKWLIEKIPDTILTDEEKTQLLQQKNEAGYSPFLVACEYQKLKVVTDLSSKVDVCEVVQETYQGDIGEKSALHIAAIHDSKDIAQQLIERGCNLTCQDAMGNTALHVAYKKSSEAVKKLLLKSKEGEQLREIKNKRGEVPRRVAVEDVIPIEILKRGPQVVESYKKALREGKEKIPRCGLLILGEARKGKTSLYKLIVGHPFDPKQQSTRGIDNNEVDAFDSRTVESWKEKSEEDQSKEREELHARAVIKELPPESSLKNTGGSSSPKEVDLMSRINKVTLQIEKEKQPKPLRIKKSHPFTTAPIIPTSVGTPRLQPFIPAPKTDENMEVDEVPPSQIADSHDPVPKPKRETSQPKPKDGNKPKPKPAPLESELRPPAPKRAATEPTPPVKPPAVARALSTGSTRKDARQVDKMIRNRQDRLATKEPSVLVNVLDFAGQKNYRPMHHCFIRRRSMYIVVFNLQDIHQFIESGGTSPDTDPFEEIRYWLHSIHAHIYPPDQSEEITEKDKHQRRILLIGTHKDPGNGLPQITSKHCEDIHRKLRSKILRDNRCSDHIRTEAKMCFIPVENSDTDSSKSGADIVRSALKKAQESFTFLNEEYPISWVRFESRLIDLASDNTQLQCVPRGEIEAIAGGVGVPNIEDALQFFHDTGKIILLKRVSNLFLTKKQTDAISELVIVCQEWLIKVMKEIMELPENFPKIKQSEQLDLEDGRVTLRALRKIWEDTINELKTVNIITVCYILQAYCLIHPIGSSDAIDDRTRFIIPCMLPKAMEEDDSRPWIKFCFDFNGFLPLEIFHRLLCMLMSKTKCEEDSELYAEMCSFVDVDDCTIKVKLDASQHKLNVFYLSHKKKPTDCLKLIHSQYLKKICEGTGLQGLRYCGGVMGGKCGCSQFQKLVEFCVRDEHTDSASSSSDGKAENFVCTHCLKTSSETDVNNFLCQQARVSGPATLSELQQRTDTTDEQLDQVIEEGILSHIALDFGDVEDLLPHLSLRLGEIADVRKEKGSKRMVIKALEFFQESKGPLSYRKLIEIVKNGLRNSVLVLKIMDSIPKPK